MSSLRMHYAILFQNIVIIKLVPIVVGLMRKVGGGRKDGLRWVGVWDDILLESISH